MMLRLLTFALLFVKWTIRSAAAQSFAPRGSDQGNHQSERSAHLPDDLIDALERFGRAKLA